MAITVQYGPLAQALGLAQVGGAGQGRNIQSQRDLQALGLQNQMQQTINSNDTNLIQMAMARDQAAQAQQDRQQQMHQQAIQQQAQQDIANRNLALNTQNVNTDNARQEAERVTREQQAKDLAAKNAQTVQDKQARDTWLQSLDQDQYNAVMSGAPLAIAKPNEVSANEQARLDAQGQQNSIKNLHDDEKSLLSQIGIINKKLIPDDSDTALKNSLSDQLNVVRTRIAQAAAPTAVSANPTKDAAPVSAGPPAGPSPYGVGGRKKMPDGSIWTWNGASWTKG